MRLHQYLIISALSFTSLSACITRQDPNSNTGDAAIESQRQEWAKTAGLYAVDGTWMDENGGTNIRGIFLRWTGANKFYSQGVQGTLGGAFAKDADTVNKEILANICRDLESGKVRRVFLTGYSRGAIQALGLSIDITTKRKCKTQPEFVWLGLLDAVNTSMYGWDDTVPSGVVAIHIVKSENKLFSTDPYATGPFTTKEINNLTTRLVWPEKTNHSQIGTNRNAEERMVQSARVFGAPL